jgi:hypothetical protein
MKVDGSCHCGKLTFEAEIDPEKVIVCHCGDCQTLSGAPYRTAAPAIKGTFKILSGDLKIYTKTAESGARRLQAFCPECGTPIYAAPEGDGMDLFGLRVGALRQRAQLVPKAQYWHQSRQPWSEDLRTLPKIDTQ